MHFPLPERNGQPRLQGAFPWGGGGGDEVEKRKSKFSRRSMLPHPPSWRTFIHPRFIRVLAAPTSPHPSPPAPPQFLATRALFIWFYVLFNRSISNPDLRKLIRLHFDAGFPYYSRFIQGTCGRK